MNVISRGLQPKKRPPRVPTTAPFADVAAAGPALPYLHAAGDAAALGMSSELASRTAASSSNSKSASVTTAEEALALYRHRRLGRQPIDADTAAAISHVLRRDAPHAEAPVMADIADAFLGPGVSNRHIAPPKGDGSTELPPAVRELYWSSVRRSAALTGGQWERVLALVDRDASPFRTMSELRSLRNGSGSMWRSALRMSMAPLAHAPGSSRQPADHRLPLPLQQLAVSQDASSVAVVAAWHSPESIGAAIEAIGGVSLSPHSGSLRAAAGVFLLKSTPSLSSDVALQLAAASLKALRLADARLPSQAATLEAVWTAGCSSVRRCGPLLAEVIHVATAAALAVKNQELGSEETATAVSLVRSILNVPVLDEGMPAFSRVAKALAGSRLIQHIPDVRAALQKTFVAESSLLPVRPSSAAAPHIEGLCRMAREGEPNTTESALAAFAAHIRRVESSDPLGLLSWDPLYEDALNRVIPALEAAAAARLPSEDLECVVKFAASRVAVGGVSESLWSKRLNNLRRLVAVARCHTSNGLLGEQTVADVVSAVTSLFDGSRPAILLKHNARFDTLAWLLRVHDDHAEHQWQESSSARWVALNRAVLGIALRYPQLVSNQRVVASSLVEAVHGREVPTLPFTREWTSDTDALWLYARWRSLHSGSQAPPTTTVLPAMRCVTLHTASTSCPAHRLPSWGDALQWVEAAVDSEATSEASSAAAVVMEAMRARRKKQEANRRAGIEASFALECLGAARSGSRRARSQKPSHTARELATELARDAHLTGNSRQRHPNSQ